MAERGQPDYTARFGEALHVYRGSDGSFEVGVGRLRVISPDITFVHGVFTDVQRLVYFPEGVEALRRGDALGQPVVIRKPEAPTEPPNAWVLPDDLSAATAPAGTGCGSTIVYNPVEWPRKGDPRSPSSGAILLTMLRQANLNASGKSDPSRPDWGDK